MPDEKPPEDENPWEKYYPETPTLYYWVRSSPQPIVTSTTGNVQWSMPSLPTPKPNPDTILATDFEEAKTWRGKILKFVVWLLT